MTIVAFHAPGIPQPQGNKTGIVRGGRAILVEGRRTKSRNAFTEWRATVRIAAAAARGETCIEGPVLVDVHFAVPRPASAPKTKRTFPSKRPDLDKYVRAVLDALSEAQVWKDDAQAVSIRATKDYPGLDGAIGAWVMVRPLGDTTDSHLAFVARTVAVRNLVEAVPA